MAQYQESENQDFALWDTMLTQLSLLFLMGKTLKDVI